MPPRFALRRKNRQQAGPASPAQPVGPTSPAPRAVTAAEARRFSGPERTVLVQTARTAAVLGGTAAVVHVGGKAISGAFDAAARKDEASRPVPGVMPVPIDVNGDGVPDGVQNVPYFLGPDGQFDVFGADPTYSRDPQSTGLEIRETAKTVGVVLIGVLVVGGGIYLLTRPSVQKAIGRAVK